MVEFNTKRGPYQLQIGTCHLLLSSVQFSSVQSLSCVWLFATPWTVARQASLSIINSWSLFKLMSIESVMPSNHLILCHPLLFLPWIFPSIRVFSNELAVCIRCPKYWSFSFSPSNEYPGLISFRIDWFEGACLVDQVVKNLPSMQEIHLQCKRPKFDSWVQKIPCRRKWQPTPVFLPGKCHGQRNLAGYSL